MGVKDQGKEGRKVNDVTKIKSKKGAGGGGTDARPDAGKQR